MSAARTAATVFAAFLLSNLFAVVIHAHIGGHSMRPEVRQRLRQASSTRPIGVKNSRRRSLRIRK